MKLKVAAGFLAAAVVILVSRSGSSTQAAGPKLMPAPGRITQGALLIRDVEGRPKLECPLKHTDVKADISGFLARVTVTQEFENTAADKVEAVYVFPLPHNAAIDNMTLQVGGRIVKGDIRRREEAQAIYDAARNSGRLAALLDQERPNIFTQSVANIAPGAKVRIVISYIERLHYEAGTYEFVFPMVVGPRYIPMAASIDGREPAASGAEPGGNWKHASPRMPDADRITPPVTRPDQRAGHDISIEVKLDAGVPVETLSSKSHEVNTERSNPSRAVVRLKDSQTIPNKDFVLRYKVAGEKISDAVLTHQASRGGFFTLMLQPPDRPASKDVTPKEIVFVLDTSGSMSGFPIEKAKESMNLAIGSLSPQDTFNLITFAGDTSILFPQPVPATSENLGKARAFLSSRHGSGGTEMMKAIRAALDSSNSQKHIRIVCFMTDGYVGNEPEIISEVQRHPNARVFSFGIGSSVNRYLLDKMAEAGRGEVEYVGLQDDGSAAARRFEERVRNPILTDISIEWNGLPVTDVVPSRIPDLFSAKPIAITGRYNGSGRGTIRLKGKFAGASISRDIAVNFPASEPRHDVLAALWARTKIDTLMHTPGEQNKESITKLGLDYRLMTPYTSFVAVEETVITEGGVPRRIQIPIEIPEGVSYEGIFGNGATPVGFAQTPMEHKFMAAPPSAGGGRGGVMGGIIGGVPPSAPRESILIAADAMKQAPVSRLHPALAGKKGSEKVRIQIFLRTSTAAILEELRKNGVEILAQPKSGAIVIGSIAADKLQALAALASVKWISPAP